MEKSEEKLVMSTPSVVASQESFEGIEAALEPSWRPPNSRCYVAHVGKVFGKRKCCDGRKTNSDAKSNIRNNF